jgi:hypothetical protein
MRGAAPRPNPGRYAHRYPDQHAHTYCHRNGDRRAHPDQHAHTHHPVPYGAPIFYAITDPATDRDPHPDGDPFTAIDHGDQDRLSLARQR